MFANNPAEPDLLPVALSLIVVVAIVFAIGFLMKRVNWVGNGSRQLRVVASLMVGTRERIAVIQVGEEQHLVGITAHAINHMGRLEQPLADLPDAPISKDWQKIITDKLSKAKGHQHDK